MRLKLLDCGNPPTQKKKEGTVKNLIEIISDYYMNATLGSLNSLKVVSLDSLPINDSPKSHFPIS